MWSTKTILVHTHCVLNQQLLDFYENIGIGVKIILPENMKIGKKDGLERQEALNMKKEAMKNAKRRIYKIIDIKKTIENLKRYMQCEKFYSVINRANF